MDKRHILMTNKLAVEGSAEQTSVKVTETTPYASEDLCRTYTLDEALESIIWVDGEFTQITATILFCSRKQGKVIAKCLKTLLHYVGFILEKVM